MARDFCLVCFISTVNGGSKKRKKRSLLWVSLVAGTQQNLSSLYYLDVYDIFQSSYSTFYKLHYFHKVNVTVSLLQNAIFFFENQPKGLTFYHYFHNPSQVRRRPKGQGRAPTCHGTFWAPLGQTLATWPAKVYTIHLTFLCQPAFTCVRT